MTIVIGLETVRDDDVDAGVATAFGKGYTFQKVYGIEEGVSTTHGIRTLSQLVWSYDRKMKTD